MPATFTKRKAITKLLRDTTGDFMNKKEYEYTAYNNQLLERARNLRKNMTPQERKLWYEFLRSYPIKIYKQRPIGIFIADFFCAKAKLIVEIDGSQHYTDEGMNKDKLRTEFFTQYGIKVIRFSNYDVDTNFYGVCTQIDIEIKNSLC